MSANNGVIRIGRKGRKKFAFGEDGPEFEVDVVVAFQRWIEIDESFRDEEDRSVATERMPHYHAAAIAFVAELSTGVFKGEPAAGIVVTTAEALDFVARLREQYDELADFFRPKSRERHDSPATSEAELRFSAETA